MSSAVDACLVEWTHDAGAGVDLTNPLRAVSHPLDAEVLQVLAATTASMSGRQLAKLATRGSVEGVRQSLQRLEAHGLVDADGHAAAVMYRLNRDHLLCGPLLAALRSTELLYERLVEAVRAWPSPPHHASLFGSTARQEASVESDIDVLLVPDAVPGREVQDEMLVDVLTHDVQRWSGNTAHVLTISPDQLRELRESHDPLLTNWLADGRLLWGASLRQLLADL